jgi:triacylglycerol lipase
MHNLCIPGTVAIFFRRVVHAVSTLSTLSIAQQYHALQGTPKPENTVLGESQPPPKTGETTLFSSEIAQKWIRAWSQVAPLEEQLTRGTKYSSTFANFSSTTAVGLSLPWLNSRWSLPPKAERIVETTVPHTEVNDTSPSPEANKSASPNPGGQRHRDPHMNDDVIHQLMYNPALYDPLRKPRFPIVLCHGRVQPLTHAA